MRTKIARKVNRSFTLTPATCETLEDLARVTGMDQSAIMDGCVQAVWSVILSGGFRQLPPTVEALSMTGAAGASFYILGKRKEEHENQRE